MVMMPCDMDVAGHPVGNGYHVTWMLMSVSCI